MGHIKQISDWLDEHRVTEIECMVLDMTGIPRGKIIRCHKYRPQQGIYLAETVFTQTVTSNYPKENFSQLIPIVG